MTPESLSKSKPRPASCSRNMSRKCVRDIWSRGAAPKYYLRFAVAIESASVTLTVGIYVEKLQRKYIGDRFHTTWHKHRRQAYSEGCFYSWDPILSVNKYLNTKAFTRKSLVYHLRAVTWACVARQEAGLRRFTRSVIMSVDVILRFASSLLDNTQLLFVFTWSMIAE